MAGKPRRTICLTRPQVHRRLRVRLHHGPLSHQVIELAATGQLGIAAAGQIRLAVVIARLITITATTARRQDGANRAAREQAQFKRH